MFQIDEPNAPATMPAIPAAGTPGWFQEGDAANGVPPIAVRAWWLNMMQAESLAILASAGLTPAKNNEQQLAQAIALIGNRRVYIANSTDGQNNKPWTVPAGVWFVKGFGHGPGGPGGPGNATSSGQALSGGAGGAGWYAEIDVPVQPGDTLLAIVGAENQVTAFYHNGALILTIAGGQTGGAASTSLEGAPGQNNGAANERAAGYTGMFLPGSIGSGGFIGGNNSTFNIGSASPRSCGPAFASGVAVGGSAGIGPGNGGCGGIGAIFGGGAGADGDFGWFY